MAALPPPALKALQERLDKEVASFRELQKQISTADASRQTCSQQFSENDMVASELARLEPGAGVFKLIGPTLIRQDLVEARANVVKRLEYIEAESERLAQQLKNLEAKQVEKQKEIVGIQRQLKAATAASGGATTT